MILSANELGLDIEFTGSGLEEVGVVKSIKGDDAPAISIGDVIVRIDSKYFRPSEVEELIGDFSKAKEVLGWSPKKTINDLCREMVKK